MDNWSLDIMVMRELESEIIGVISHMHSNLTSGYTMIVLCFD